MNGMYFSSFFSHLTRREEAPPNSLCFHPNGRLTAPQLMEHPFLAVEPEVVLLQTSSDSKNYLQMQVVFKGMDKLSVKFDYNVDTDTAAEVVKEMIDEQGLLIYFV